MISRNSIPVIRVKHAWVRCCISECLIVIYFYPATAISIFYNFIAVINKIDLGTAEFKERIPDHLFQYWVRWDLSNLEKILAGLALSLPPEAARYNLADILIGVLTQKLVRRRGGGLILANEILLNNAAVKSLIREGKIYQIESVMQTSRKEGMISLDRSLNNLIEAGEVRREDI